MAQMSHPIKHDSLPHVPVCALIRFAQNSFFVLRRIPFLCCGPSLVHQWH